MSDFIFPQQLFPSFSRRRTFQLGFAESKLSANHGIRSPQAAIRRLKPAEIELLVKRIPSAKSPMPSPAWRGWPRRGAGCRGDPYKKIAWARFAVKTEMACTCVAYELR